MMNDGCMVTVTVTGGMESWARSCCMTAACLNDHTSVGGIDMWNERYGCWDQINVHVFFTLNFSCDTENCNTMDPRNSGESTAHTLGFTLGLNAILFAIARMI